MGESLHPVHYKMISSNFEHCLLFTIYNWDAVSDNIIFKCYVKIHSSHDNAMKLVGDIDMVNKLIVYWFYDIKERE